MHTLNKITWAVYEKPIANAILNRKMLEVFPLSSAKRPVSPSVSVKKIVYFHSENEVRTFCHTKKNHYKMEEPLKVIEKNLREMLNGIIQAVMFRL